MKITAHDLDIMARTVFGEARGEDQAGRVAVVWVILNRAEHKTRWPNQPADACKQPLQFSAWNENDPNYQLVSQDFDYADPMRASCMLGVIHTVVAFHSGAEDPTDGANHYFSDKITAPVWAAQMIETAHIGGHLFFRDE